MNSFWESNLIFVFFLSHGGSCDADRNWAIVVDIKIRHAENETNFVQTIGSRYAHCD